jgi:hypothetical protein
MPQIITVVGDLTRSLTPVPPFFRPYPLESRRVKPPNPRSVIPTERRFRVSRPTISGRGDLPLSRVPIFTPGGHPFEHYNRNTHNHHHFTPQISPPT